MFTGKWEARVVVIEGRVAPTTGRMARAAIRAELPVMFILRRMACITIRRCTFIYAIGVACTALYV